MSSTGWGNIRRSVIQISSFRSRGAQEAGRMPPNDLAQKALATLWRNRGRSRRLYRQAGQLPMPVEKLIVALKREYTTWGARKIRERLRRKWPGLAARP